MRLAEFKTRLFIFFAGRLLKWVESIEPEIEYGQSPPATPVDDSNPVLFAEPSRESEAASGPPEHWARLLASDPPKHWLDLIGEKGPHLLSPTENNPISQAGVESFGEEEFPTDTNQEATRTPASEQSAVERSQPPLLRSVPSRREIKYSAAKSGRSTWLNRLHFHPPARRTEGLEPNYVPDARTGNLDSSPAAGGAANEGFESTLRQPTSSADKARHRSQGKAPDKTVAARKAIARLLGNLRREKPEGDHYVHHRAGAEHVELRRIDSEPASQESFSNHSGKQSRREQTTAETLRETSHTNPSNTLFGRGDTHATDARAQSRNESIGDHHVESLPRTAPRFGGLDRVRGVNPEERERSRSPASVFHQTSVEPAVELNRVPSWIDKETTRTRQVHHRKGLSAGDDGTNAPVSANVANSWVRNKTSSSRPVISVGATDEKATNAFASVELGAPTSKESRTKPAENLWPTLPPMPKFDTADELAAMEQEAEALRRLDQEQRGTLWNA